MKPKRSLGVGLIGSGFMGKTHAFGYATAARVFDLPFDIDLACVADQNSNTAAAAQAAFGFRRATGDWRTLIDDADVDVVDITAPNALHKEMALAAIAAGKHVYCEKPLAPKAEDADEMTKAAEAAGVKTQVGFNYLANPMLTFARELIAQGRLGDIYTFRGVHAEDYMADPASPLTWRHDPIGGGALADLGSHVLATAEFLLGPISDVLGATNTKIDSRPGPDGSAVGVDVDDIGWAILKFANGVSGSLEASWVSTGRKMQHSFEVYGSKGAIAFSGEQLNELEIYDAGDQPGTQGFRKILAAPEHEPYGRFCVAPGHQLGFNDLKAIEIEGFLAAIAGHRPEPFNFRAGLRVQSIVETIHRSARKGGWQRVPD